MTKADRIRKMSNEELALLIEEIATECNYQGVHRGCRYCKKLYCNAELFEKWLQSDESI